MLEKGTEAACEERTFDKGNGNGTLDLVALASAGERSAPEWDGTTERNDIPKWCAIIARQTCSPVLGLDPMILFARAEMLYDSGERQQAVSMLHRAAQKASGLDASLYKRRASSIQREIGVRNREEAARARIAAERARIAAEREARAARKAARKAAVKRISSSWLVTAEFSREQTAKLCRVAGFKWTYESTGHKDIARCETYEYSYTYAFCNDLLCLEGSHAKRMRDDLKSHEGQAQAFDNRKGVETSRGRIRTTTWKSDPRIVSAGGNSLAARLTSTTYKTRAIFARARMRPDAPRGLKEAFFKLQERSLLAIADEEIAILKSRPYCKRYKDLQNCPYFYRDTFGDCRFREGNVLDVISPRNAYKTRSRAGEPAWCSGPCVQRWAGNLHPAAVQALCCSRIEELPSGQCPKFYSNR